MYQRLKDRGLEVVGITRLYGYYKNERDLPPDEEFKRLAEFIKEFDLPWPLVVGPQSNFEAYGVGGIPQYVVIGRDGKVASITIGYNEALHKELEASVEKALSQKATTASR